MARLKTATGVTVEVSDEKAERLLATSNYEAEAKKASAPRATSSKTDK